MAETDPVLQDHGLTGVDVQAGQILDVALLADDDLVLVGPQHGPVPDARGPAQPDGPDHDGTGRDPRLGMDDRYRVAQ
jgi:hypothetical protein